MGSDRTTRPSLLHVPLGSSAFADIDADSIPLIGIVRFGNISDKGIELGMIPRPTVSVKVSETEFQVPLVAGKGFETKVNNCAALDCKPVDTTPLDTPLQECPSLFSSVRIVTLPPSCMIRPSKIAALQIDDRSHVPSQ